MSGIQRDQIHDQTVVPPRIVKLHFRNSLVVCDESGHTKFPFPFVVLSWGELRLICPELPLILP